LYYGLLNIGGATSYPVFLQPLQLLRNGILPNSYPYTALDHFVLFNAIYATGSQSGLCRPLCGGGGGITHGAQRGKGALEMGLSDRVVGLFTIEVTSHQTLGNWYHFIKPIHRIKNLLTVKYLLNAMSYFITFFGKGKVVPVLK
jgi:hypothetical protein